jgi:hypothetical protein
MTLDPGVRALLEAISRAVEGMPGWRTVGVSVAVDRVLDGADPGVEADELAGFLAERERAERGLTYPELGDDLKRAGEQMTQHKAGRP